MRPFMLFHRPSGHGERERRRSFTDQLSLPADRNQRRLSAPSLAGFGGSTRKSLRRLHVDPSTHTRDDPGSFFDGVLLFPARRRRVLRRFSTINMDIQIRQTWIIIGIIMGSVMITVLILIAVVIGGLSAATKSGHGEVLNIWRTVLLLY